MLSYALKCYVVNPSLSLDGNTDDTDKNGCSRDESTGNMIGTCIDSKGSTD